MKKIYVLSSCSTCQRILKEINPSSEFTIQDIKQENIDAETLDWVAKKVGSYEDLFSKRAMKYKALGLKDMNLSESDFRQYMLDEYTFLKRPFIINEEEVFIGNAKKEVAAALASIANK
ncbi:MAG: arsenate reductase [Lentimonas sp.]|jgi:arsenate reductase